MHAPGVGAVWDSGCSLLRTEDAALLPTKTSLVNGQRLGSLPFAVNAGFQVVFNFGGKVVAIGAGGGIVRCSKMTIGRSLVLQGGVPTL